MPGNESGKKRWKMGAQAVECERLRRTKWESNPAHRATAYEIRIHGNRKVENFN